MGKRANIAILGGGILGLSAAYNCLTRGLGDVTVYESDEEPGGLARTFEVCGTRLEMYHHFLCDTDRVILNQMSEFGLSEHIKWGDCRMGMFSSGRQWDFTTPLDLLRFGALSLTSRLRFGLAMLLLQRKTDWRPLESVSATRWLKRWTGERAYEVVWSHLMKSKFDCFEDQIPLSWLWARTTRRAGSKREGSALEHFGYVSGSVAILIDEYMKRIAQMGGEVQTECKVTGIERTREGEFQIESKLGNRVHRAVISSIPLPALLSAVDFFPDGYRTRLASIRYQTVLNMSIILKRPFSNFFWLNIGDSAIPFPGIIEFSHLRPEFDGRSVIYLPNYLPEEHRLNSLSDEELFDEFVEALGRISPGFTADQIESFHVFRHPHADPYYTLNYSKLLPEHSTLFKRFYIYNTAQIYPITRNVSNSILFGQDAARLLEKDLKG